MRRPIPEVTNHAPWSSLPSMLPKPRFHHCRRRRDWGRQQRRLTDGIEEYMTRREDDDEDDEGRSKESGGWICCPGQNTGGRWDAVVSVIWQRR